MALSNHIFRRLAVVSRFVPTTTNAIPLRHISSVARSSPSRLPSLVSSAPLIVKTSSFEPRRSFVRISETGVRQYTREEVAEHDTEEDCWIIIDNKVYDVTKWIPIHPGGTIILTRAGRDSTTLFLSAPHSNWTYQELPKYEIGELVPDQRGHRFDGIGGRFIPDESL
eukprot:TRINITY_DN3228_c0_g1_i1.p1 TRINITY_DN3228_c0_g1~~TRINITY_DN3228_c0_g1_i1.p1  ORF type:complete len:168 (-),score=37.31 TRINITY_DN3228_c0_g1_i1:46-549(-)